MKRFILESLPMIDTYEERKVDLYNFPNEVGYISTVRVTDGRLPYETAVCHKEYTGEAGIAVVEAYETRAKAKAGHKRWVKLMLEKPPKSIKEINNCEWAYELGLSEDEYKRKV